MKNPTLLLIILIVVLACQPNKLRKMSDEEFIKRAVNNNLPKPNDVTILNTSGSEISADSFFTLLQSNTQYFQDFYVNKEGNIVHLVNREKNQKDDELIKEINEAFQKTNLDAPREAVEQINIDCSDIKNILESAYDSDQGTRKSGTMDLQVDRNNLVTIVSLIEQCGIPTLNDVSQKQMSAIFLVLQHAEPFYQSRYIPLIEKSAENGDISKSSLALMKDRALMYKGQPQIYGSQVSNGELYDLFEPEYVDQRRAEIRMGPLRDYLARFDIIFDVPQKKK